MNLHVCVLGIDGSGKSTVVAALPAILAAEHGLVAGSAGDSFRIVAPDQDHLATAFYPDGLPIAARLSLRLKHLAKRVVDHPKLYAVFKLAHILSQDSAAEALAQRYSTRVFVSDGNALLSTTGPPGGFLIYSRRQAGPCGEQSKAATTSQRQAHLQTQQAASTACRMAAGRRDLSRHFA